MTAIAVRASGHGVQQALWPHLAMWGALTLAAAHHIPATAHHNPETGDCTITTDPQRLAAAIKAEAAFVADTSGPWAQTIDGIRPVLTADWGPTIDRRAFVDQLERRAALVDALPSHHRALVRGFGFPTCPAGTETSRLKVVRQWQQAAGKPRAGVSRWDMTSLSKGGDIVRRRFTVAAQQLAARPAAAVVDSLNGRIVHTGRSVDLVPGWAYVPPGELDPLADVTHAWLALWGMAMLPTRAGRSPGWCGFSPQVGLLLVPMVTTPASADWWTTYLAGPQWRHVCEEIALTPYAPTSDWSHLAAVGVWRREIQQRGPSMRMFAQWDRLVTERPYPWCTKDRRL
ncbi:hypothetical protein F0Q45_10375 [Mycobacterium simiae]|uniref:Uncharacterized protein n=1 Tax=Mycobacterium simiae TaxID=1784 RepID=A0A5B1BST7_MYCSI|nr:hypothetical protein [Mycobacterium simiae]KAA1250334.1 hypothetical protein F0Q45_10375 [Mycobacterium simiae]